MIKEKISRIFFMLGLGRPKNVAIGWRVEFINTGKIVSANSFLGCIENKSVKIANKSPRSYLNNSGNISLGEMVRIHKGFGIDVSGKLTIGNKTYINPDSIIVCRHEISIGNNCAIGWRVTIMDDDLHSASSPSKKDRNIIIEDDVWIGANVLITKGVKIGKGSIIAAGTTVTKDIPPRVLFAGNPGKVVRENVTWA
jgi:acetyltransferase-like isoleucine patch superfamily enzyme